MDGNKIINGILTDLKGVIDVDMWKRKLLKKYYKGGKLNPTKLAVDLIPFLSIFYFVNKYAQACMASGKDDLIDAMIAGFPLLFQTRPYYLPTLKFVPFVCGIGVYAAFRIFMNEHNKNAKKFRHGEEYGSSRWGNDKDFEPYTDPDKWKNIPLTETEWLRMTRPEHPKYDRNKNVEIVGGSGSGKTRGYTKPNIMQMYGSYVVTDPKGTVLVEVGKMLQKGGYLYDTIMSDQEKKKYKNYPRDKIGRVLSKKTGKPIRKPYDIKVFNTINTKKSLHYNPFVYIYSEQDINKFVQCLISNTKGEGVQSGEDFWVKAETLLITAYTAYIVETAPMEDRNFASLLEMLNASETREDDEEFKNAVDMMFDDLEFGVRIPKTYQRDENGNYILDEYGEKMVAEWETDDNGEAVYYKGYEPHPDSFAVNQYKKYKLAAGKTAKSILISAGARLAPFDIKEIRELTMFDELELGDLGRRRSALFVIISDTDDSLNFIVSIMYTQLFNLLCTIADDEYHGKLPVHVRCILDEFANIGRIPKFDKLNATIRSREISASIILQSSAQLKSIYKDNAEVIEDNCDTFLFLGGKGKSTLKDLSEMLGKETIDTYNESDTRGTSRSYGQNYQKLGHELMSIDQLRQMDGGKCIMQLRGLPSFLSNKVDITKHEMYKELSDYDPANEFDIEEYVKHYSEIKLPKRQKKIYKFGANDLFPDTLLTDLAKEISSAV